MTGLVDRVRGVLPQRRPGTGESVVARVDALTRFLRAADGRVPDDQLVPARTVVERAGARLALSREHTVVALAGATGSGKSSLFNAIATLRLSPVGMRRPTTDVTHACVWGPLTAATGLLDWLGVLPRHRFVRESALDADDQAALHGLVLVDLPDFDSVERGHRVEVDRLLGLVDLVVWVVDPQKYADRLVHETYLRQLSRHRDVTVVALNHADRLAPAELSLLLDDLRRLLDADGLGGIPVIATSAVDPQGTGQLRELIQRAVAGRQAALHRLTGDLDVVADGLTPLVGPPADGGRLDRAAVRDLTGALADRSGVPAVSQAVADAYRLRAAGATGWPLLRWARRFRADPLRRLHLTGGPHVPGTPVPVTSLPDPDAAQRAAVGLAVRAVADRAAHGLPAPWPTAVTTAARSRLDDLPDALDRAVATTGPALPEPLWWRVVGGAQWLAAGTALAGLAWLAVGWLAAALGLGLEHPRVGILPVPTAMLLGGLLAGLLIATVSRPVAAWAAARLRRRTAARLHQAVADVAREYVVAPIREVLQAYADAREALAVAAYRD